MTKRNLYRVVIIVGIVVGYLLYVRFVLDLVEWQDWTGFGEYTSPNGDFRPAKTLWDWLDLLIIPIVLAIGAWWLNKTEREAEREAAEKRTETDREIALDRQRQTTLQAYYDRMTDLLLEKGLYDAPENAPVLDIARTQTLVTLRGLDDERKGQVIRFVCEADLLKVSLHGANLMEANLRMANLSKADLSAANLARANLVGANLVGANLDAADLSGAELRGGKLAEVSLIGADLINADLSGAELIEARLSGADLGMANLTAANLTKARLVGAKLGRAQLIGTDLGEAKLMQADLSKVINLSQANLRGASYNNETQWPEGFDPRAAGAVLMESD